LLKLFSFCKSLSTRFGFAETHFVRFQAA